MSFYVLQLYKLVLYISYPCLYSKFALLRYNAHYTIPLKLSKIRTLSYISCFSKLKFKGITCKMYRGALLQSQQSIHLSYCLHLNPLRIYVFFTYYALLCLLPASLLPALKLKISDTRISLSSYTRVQTNDYRYNFSWIYRTLKHMTSCFSYCCFTGVRVQYEYVRVFL